jgi:hypothetical protein
VDRLRGVVACDLQATGGYSQLPACLHLPTRPTRRLHMRKRVSCVTIGNLTKGLNFEAIADATAQEVPLMGVYFKMKICMWDLDNFFLCFGRRWGL